MKNMRRNAVAKRLMTLAATAVLCAFSWTVQAEEMAQARPALIKVKAAMTLTELVQNASYYAALKSGTFAEEGVSVETVYFRSWTEPVQAIAADAAQFAYTASSLIRAVVGQNAPLRLVAMGSSRYPYDLVVKKDSGLKTLADLRGKTIQTVRPGETLDNIWRQILTDANVPLGDVKRIESFNGLGSVISGLVDVGNVTDTNVMQVRKAGLVNFLDYTEWREKKGWGSDAGANVGWGTSMKLLQENPAAVRGFLRGLIRANERLIKDKEFAFSVLREKPFQVEDPDALEWIYARHRQHWIMRMDFKKDDARFDAEMIEVAMGRPKGSIPLSSFAVEEPITGILKEMNVRY
jgi:ABC-type nitrate/sulfonate/bicarbonate transport system substrate-binding protein